MGDRAGDRAAPYVLAPGASRRPGTVLAFEATSADTGGLLSVCEFSLGPWETGPVLHLHTSVDEALCIVAGDADVQLGDERVTAPAGAFVWMRRRVAHAFASAGPEPLRAVAIAVPGGLAYRTTGGTECVPEPNPDDR